MMLTGMKAFVTGASSGIGAATAERLVQDGAEVALVGRRGARLREVAGRISAHGAGKTHVYELDVVNVDASRRVVDEFAGGEGGLDVLVHCAGTGSWGLAMEADLADWNDMLDVNLRAVMSMTRLALPHLARAASGPRGVADVVSISSVAGRKVPFPMGSVYAATKHAVGAFSEGLRQEMGPRHVRVGLVEPGIVATEMTTRGSPNGPDARHPQGLGFLTADDVARAVHYMISQPKHAAINEILLRPTEQIV